MTEQTATVPTLEFGLPLPTDRRIARAWGCRAILTNHRGKPALDVVWNRKGYWPEGDKPPAEFKLWIEHVVNTWLSDNREAGGILRDFDSRSRDVREIDRDYFGARASTCASHGYLYVCAWQLAD